jgi:hypothetical protein
MLIIYFIQLLSLKKYLYNVITINITLLKCARWRARVTSINDWWDGTRKLQLAWQGHKPT